MASVADANWTNPVVYTTINGSQLPVGAARGGRRMGSRILTRDKARSCLALKVQLVPQLESTFPCRYGGRVQHPPTHK